MIKQLQERLAAERNDSKRQQERLGRLESVLASKNAERDRILGLFRKGRISEADLERQMDEIEREEAGLRARRPGCEPKSPGQPNFAANRQCDCNSLKARVGFREERR